MALWRSRVRSASGPPFSTRTRSKKRTQITETTNYWFDFSLSENSPRESQYFDPKGTLTLVAVKSGEPNWCLPQGIDIGALDGAGVLGEGDVTGSPQSPKEHATDIFP